MFTMKICFFNPDVRPFFLCALFFFTLVISACSNNNETKPAPLGNLTALENLAVSYTEVSGHFPMNVRSLPPQQKREFLEQVFKKSGYDYTATIITMGNSPLDNSNKNQKDLAELVLLPTVGISNEAVSDIYSDEEMQALNKIQAALR